MITLKTFSIFFRFCAITLTIFIVFISCRPDNQLASWEVEALTPILNSRLDIIDLIPDSIHSVNASSEVSIQYRSKLGEFKFDRITEGFTKSFINSVKLENIDLGSRTVSNKISLGYIASKAGVTGAFINANNGNRAVVFPINNIGPETFLFDASEYFQTITLDDGWLTIRINNGLPLDLTNVQYSIQNQSGGTPITNNTIASIPANSVVTDSVRLNNRVVIEGKLMAVLHNLDSPGSNGDTVLIDTSDVINVTVSMTDLKPYSATAIFPSQTLIRDTTNTEVENFNGELTSMFVKSGTIFLNATSTIEDEIIFDYLVPSAVQNGITLEFQEKVPPAPPSGFSTKYAEQDLNNYTVDLTGPPGSNLYNTFYTITNGRIDSSGNLINLSLTDSVFLETGVKDLIASRAYGYLGKDTLSSIENNKLDIFNAIKGGTIDFEDLDINLDLESFIGAPISLHLNDVTAIKNSNTIALNWNQLGQEQTLPAAIENNPGQMPSPGLLTLNLNNNNSNIDALLESLPDIINTDLTAYVNKNLGAPDYNQFIYLDYGINVFLSTDIPLKLSFNDLLFRDTAKFIYSNLDAENRLTGGELILIGNNHFPFSLQIDILLMNNDSIIIDSIQSSEIMQPALVDGVGVVIEAVKSHVHYPLNAEVIASLKETSFIIFEAKFNSANQPDKVILKSDNYLDLTLSGDLKVKSQ